MDCVKKSRKDVNKELNSSYCLDKKCFSREELKDLFIDFGNEFESGYFGTLYQVCAEDHNCTKVLKIIPLAEHEDDFIRAPINNDCNPLRFDGVENNTPYNEWNCIPYTKKEFYNEVDMTEIMSELEVGPKYYDSWICKNVVLDISDEISKKQNKQQTLGFILMEKINGINLTKFGESCLTNDQYFTVKEKGFSKALKIEKENLRLIDLHSGNILITEDLDVFFVDFGHVARIKEYESYTTKSFIKILDKFRC